jgi:hypothetical protein
MDPERFAGSGFGSGKIIPETDSLIIKKIMQDPDPDLKPKLPSKSEPDPEPKTGSTMLALGQCMKIMKSK